MVLSRRCAGATNWPSVRASATIDASCMPADANVRHVLRGEHARLLRLHDEHALEQTAIDDGHAEEGAVRIFAGFAEVLEAWMCRRVGDVLRPELLGDETGESFAQPHAHAADAIGIEADRRGQHQIRAVGFEQIGGADVGAEVPLNEMNDVAERFRGVPGRRHEPAQFVGRPRRRAVAAGCRHAWI